MTLTGRFLRPGKAAPAFFTGTQLEFGASLVLQREVVKLNIDDNSNLQAFTCEIKGFTGGNGLLGVVRKSNGARNLHCRRKMGRSSEEDRPLGSSALQTTFG